MTIKHPYEWEVSRLERLLEEAGKELGSEVSGGKARAAVHIGVAQEVLRGMNIRMWDDHRAAQEANGPDKAD